MLILDPVDRKIDRLWALGYTEAKRRRSPLAQLDALLETSVAICDLFAPPLQQNDFYLSVVDLRAGSDVVSSLAPFDSDLRQALQYLAQGSSEFSTDDCTLAVPKVAAPKVTTAFECLWKEAVTDFGLNLRATLSARGRQQQPTHPDDDDSADFGRSLRHAFDAIFLDEWKAVDNDAATYRAYALRIHRDASATTINGHAINYSLGYWLPTRVLHYLSTRSRSPLNPREIEILETAQMPPAPYHARSQSHTNVETRLAGVVRNQAVRSSLLRKDPNRAAFDKIDALETKAWGDKQPDHVFLMPIADDHVGSGRPVTIAHWYIGINGTPDLEWLVALRHRASIIFAESFLRRYYTAVARILAANLVLSMEPMSSEERFALTSRLSEVAESYGIPPQVGLSDGMRDDNVLIDLKKILELDLSVAKDARSAEWSSKYLRRLISIRLAPGGGLDKLEVRLRLIQALDREVRELEFNAKIAAELITLNRAIADLKDVHASIQIMAAPDDEGARIWKKLDAMRQLSSGGYTDDVHVYKDFPVSLNGWSEWWFIPGHAVCAENCLCCKAEEVRRAAFLCGVPLPPESKPREPLVFDSSEWKAADDSSQGRVRTFLEAFPGHGALKIIKRACEDAHQPKLATIVAVLMAAGATLQVHDEVDIFQTMKGTPEAWPLALVGLAKLSRHNAGGAKLESRIALTIADSALLFKVTGNDSYEWFFTEQEKASRAQGPLSTATRANHSRFENVVNAYGWRSPLPLQIVEVPMITFGAVSNPTALVCTWKDVITTAQDVVGNRL